jgi:hypothetical protein
METERFYNLDFVLKLRYRKSKNTLSDNTFLRLNNSKSSFFRWNVFLNNLCGTELFTNPYLFLHELRKNITVINNVCEMHHIKMIVADKPTKAAAGDYDLVGLKFTHEHQKVFFMLKYGSIIEECR